ncbi:MAG: hypothetical protein K2Q20_03155 [Phycisphaerales bacterium]|nr:hypothetical protein [Phycisphaerales bacterium]
MPTYDYHCTACDHRFEQFQSMKDKPLKKCPSCGKSALERLIGIGAAVIFKGSGFYQTDYRSESYKKSAEADKPAATTEAKPADGKPSETKADAKSADSKPSETPKAAEPAKPVKADAPKPKAAKGKSKK